MKPTAYKRQRLNRVTVGRMASRDTHGNNGAFLIPVAGEVLTVIVSDGSDWILDGPAWEHVSVSHRDRTPTWSEMDTIKRLWWYDAETVIQYHVPRSRHVNIHEHCLHLWKPPTEIPLPPIDAV